jgi:hypothetical protein
MDERLTEVPLSIWNVGEADFRFSNYIVTATNTQCSARTDLPLPRIDGLRVEVDLSELKGHWTDSVVDTTNAARLHMLLVFGITSHGTTWRSVANKSVPPLQPKKLQVFGGGHTWFSRDPEKEEGEQRIEFSSRSESFGTEPFALRVRLCQAYVDALHRPEKPLKGLVEYPGRNTVEISPSAVRSASTQS